MSAAELTSPLWQRTDIRQIEDCRNAVLGAGLDVVQMDGPRISGSLAFAARDGIIFSSGLINGKVALRGPLSPDSITLFIGLRLGTGSRLWLNEVAGGTVGVFRAGDELDAIFTPGTLYTAATLSAEWLTLEAERDGLPLDGRMINSSGLYSTPLPLPIVDRLRERLSAIHNTRATTVQDQFEVDATLLRSTINHSLHLLSDGARNRPMGRARIVHRAREYIRENLAEPISIDDLTRAAVTTRRTLYRVFSETLGDTPQRYIRRLRLHCLRQDLVSGSGAAHTLSFLANRWGIGGDMGRMSSRYQELFGEMPSRTLASSQARRRANLCV